MNYKEILLVFCNFIGGMSSKNTISDKQAILQK